MARLTSSLAAGCSFSSQPSSTCDQAPVSTGRTVSPALPNGGNTATTNAYRIALKSFQKSLPEKDLKVFNIPVGPDNLLEDLERWQKKHQKGNKYSRVATRVRAGISRLRRFSDSVDLLAQGSPSPGCLLWGSIKLVLTVVKDAAEEYEKLCKALSHMTECLPRIEIYTETFSNSNALQECVGAFYVSALRFWTKACKFYSRRRLWNILRVVWNDYEMEFGEFEYEMEANKERVEKAAIAEHIAESQVSRTQQRVVSEKLLNSQISKRQKEIIAWLAPGDYDVDYYRNDLVSTKALRHQRTCEWVLGKDAFLQSMNTPPNEISLLWIYARPGAGKTVLSSFLVDHFSNSQISLSGHVLYFFCKDMDADKNTPVAIIRSLLYQLYQLLQTQGCCSSLICDLEHAVDKSGQRRAVNFSILWQLFSNHVESLSSATIVLDALDECHDPDPLIHGLTGLASSRRIHVIVTSRIERHLHEQLGKSLSLEINPEDIHSDITAFVEAKVSASSRLSQPSVRESVVTKLCNSHGGMFLWVYLVLKELKTCISSKQVDEALRNLPKGLDGLYKSITQRLNATLEKNSLELCCKVMAWVLTATRPLKVDEIKEALAFHYQLDGHILLCDDGSFPYSHKDIELACGSLVTIQNGTLQVIHLTVKDYLKSSSGSTSSDFCIEPRQASLQLTAVCFLYIAAHCTTPMVDLDLITARMDAEIDPTSVSCRRLESPFIEYASFFWLVHLTDCEGSDALKLANLFHKAFNSKSTFCWVEMCMALQPHLVLDLLLGFKDVLDWIAKLDMNQWTADETKDILFIDQLSSALQQVFEEYGGLLSKRPCEIHFLELRKCFSNQYLSGFYDSQSYTRARDVALHFDQFTNVIATKTLLTHQDRLDPGPESTGFFHYDDRRDVYFWSELFRSTNGHVFYVQQAGSGRSLPPVKDLERESFNGVIVGHAMSADGKYLALAYQELPSVRQVTEIWQIDEHIDFRKRLQNERWARRIFCHIRQSDVILESSKSLVFRHDGYCCSPSGLIYPSDGTRLPIPDKLCVSERDDLSICLLMYSGNGEYLFLFERPDCVTRYTLPEMTIATKFFWHVKRSPHSISHSGRYIVLYHHFTQTKAAEDPSLAIFDTELERAILLPDSESFSSPYSFLYFLEEETKIIGFSSGPMGCQAVKWVGLPNEIEVWGKTRASPIYASINTEIQVQKNETTLLMLTTGNIIRRVHIGESINFPDLEDSMTSYPCRTWGISDDGKWGACIDYGIEKTLVQIMDLKQEDACPRSLQIERQPSIDPNRMIVKTSPDLRLLVVDKQVYNLAEKDDKVASKPFTVLDLHNLQPEDQTASKCGNYSCTISPRNDYIAYTIPDEDSFHQQNSPGCLSLFRLDVKMKCSVLVDLPLPKNLIKVSVCFHPSIPLMMLRYEADSETDSEMVGQKLPQLHKTIIELETLKKRPLRFPEGKAWQALELYLNKYPNQWIDYPNTFGFGSSAVMPFLQNPWSSTGRYEEILKTPRYLRGNEFIFGLSSNDVLHMIWVSRAYIILHLVRSTERDPGGNAFGNDCMIRLLPLPSYMERIATVVLLLGDTDNEKMRILTSRPGNSMPKITVLSLSFAEALARLDKKWNRLHARRRVTRAVEEN